jgi:endonuclease G, mitochondrial
MDKKLKRLSSAGMRKFLFFFLIILGFSCGKNNEITPDENLSFEPISSGQIIKHTYYSLAYSEENEQAFWVFYQLSSDNIGNQDRTDDFRADPAVTSGSASLIDYKGSGYDRGHLCPAADMSQNKISMSETFFLSNMSPQTPGFNRGIWSTLEEKIRAWAATYSKTYVVTGPIFKDNITVIGENKVTVPGYYYKVIYDGHEKMIGLILPNASSSLSLDNFVVSVDQIELLTGIDFFANLNDKLENELEAKSEWNNWK